MNRGVGFFIALDIATYVFYEGCLSWKIIGEDKHIRETGANEKVPLRHITRRMLAVLVPHKTLNDGFFMIKLDRICELESISGISVLDMFDDDPLFSEYGDLKGLARNRQFERMMKSRQKTK
jgi:hypothetical protein